MQTVLRSPKRRRLPGETMSSEEALFTDRVIKVGLIKYGQQIFDVESININVTASSKARISFYVDMCVVLYTHQVVL